MGNLSKVKGEKLYLNACDFYIGLMRSKKLMPGDKMPSLRVAAQNTGLSRTTIESAYNQMAADGYIYAKEKSGFFVTDLALKEGAKETRSVRHAKIGADNKNIKKILYDFATIGEDENASCIELWRRYIKSALRQEDRLLSYARYQGEEDLRFEIASYVKRSRNILVSPDDIVIGAGFQNLLHILMPLMEEKRDISLPTKNYKESAKVFSDLGYEVTYRNKEASVIYVTPGYMTKWGEVMTIKRRHELLDHAKETNKFIIEDDYLNEFVYSNKATPSLYALSGGENVAYLGSFSRILLPSVRVSFLILPGNLSERYKMLGSFYNQSASVAEQIALTQFLRDGHLTRHIKKIKRLYQVKRQVLEDALLSEFEGNAQVLVGESGMEFGLRFYNVENVKELREKANENGVDVDVLDESTLLLSCGIISEDQIVEGVHQLAIALTDKS